MAFVHNNGSNVDCAARSMETNHGWYSLGCAGHTLQLCVNAGLAIVSVFALLPVLFGLLSLLKMICPLIHQCKFQLRWNLSSFG